MEIPQLHINDAGRKSPHGLRKNTETDKIALHLILVLDMLQRPMRDPPFFFCQRDDSQRPHQFGITILERPLTNMMGQLGKVQSKAPLQMRRLPHRRQFSLGFGQYGFFYGSIKISRIVVWF